MSGIDNIIQKINQDNEVRIEQLKNDTAISIEEINALENNKAQEKIDAMEKEISKKIAEVDRNAKSAADMANRQEVLKTRREMLTIAFDKVIEQMNNMDEAKRTAYVKAVVTNAACGCEVLVASKNDSIFTDGLLAEINAALVAAGKQGNLTYDLKDENINGVILVKGGMIINLTYEAVVKEIQTQIDTDVAKILFEI